MAGYQPVCAFVVFSVGQNLRQGDKAQFGVATGHKLVALTHTVGVHYPALQRRPQAHGFEHFERRLAVGRQPGVGHGQVRKLTCAQYRTLRVDQARLAAP